MAEEVSHQSDCIGDGNRAIAVEIQDRQVAGRRQALLVAGRRLPPALEEARGRALEDFIAELESRFAAVWAQPAGG